MSRYKPFALHNRGGRRVIRPDAAANARTRKVRVTTGADSKTLLTASLDLRTRLGRIYLGHKQALVAHLGGDPSAVQLRLIDQAARLRLVCDIAWGELSRRGAFSPSGDPRPALDAFRRAAADERDVLRLLGLRRAVREIDLKDYLAQSKEDEDGHSASD